MGSIDIIRLLSDFGIQYVTEGHHHCTSGFVQVHCPFCGRKNYHLGIAKDGAGANCWACGPHSTISVIAELLGIGEQKARSIISLYKVPVLRGLQKESVLRGKKPIEYPLGTGPLQEIHRKYLRGRGFDPDELEKIWDLKGTGPVGPYKHRIIIPYTYKGVTVTYQGRDVTGLSPVRYKSCSSEDEVMSIKHILYGIDYCQKESVIVVEGPIDVWRLGPGNAVATTGIAWGQRQLLELGAFKKVFVLYDPEPTALTQAEKLAEALALLGVETHVVTGVESDPADLDQSTADRIVEELLGND